MENVDYVKRSITKISSLLLTKVLSYLKQSAQGPIFGQRKVTPTYAPDLQTLFSQYKLFVQGH